MRRSAAGITLRLAGVVFGLWLLCVTAGMAVGYLNQHGQIVFEYNSRLTVLDVVTGERYRMDLLVDFSTAPAWSPDGRYLAAIDHNNRQVLITTANNRRTRSIASPAYLKNPVWSPDGNALAVTGYGNYASGVFVNSEVYLLVKDGDALADTTHTPELREDVCAWSPDSAYLACGAVLDGIQSRHYVLRLADGQRTSLSDLIDERIIWFDWIPGTHRLLLAVMTNRLYQFDLDTGTIQPLDFGLRSPAISPDGRFIAGLITDVAQQTAVVIFDMQGALIQQAAIGPVTAVGDVAWSPDGQQVALSVLREDEFRRGYLYVLDVDTGDLRWIFRAASSDVLIFRWRPLSR